MSLFPQTTTFYAGIVHESPENSADDYQILFEDSTCESGYSKPLKVPQRYGERFTKGVNLILI
jgi:hypothetical protein